LQGTSRCSSLLPNNPALTLTRQNSAPQLSSPLSAARELPTLREDEKLQSATSWEATSTLAASSRQQHAFSTSSTLSAHDAPFSSFSATATTTKLVGPKPGVRSTRAMSEQALQSLAEFDGRCRDEDDDDLLDDLTSKRLLDVDNGKSHSRSLLLFHRFFSRALTLFFVNTASRLLPHHFSPPPRCKCSTGCRIRRIFEQQRSALP
jgi:hypothetical protein